MAFVSFEENSELSLAQFLQQCRSVVAPARMFGTTNGDPPFVGVVSEGGFRLRSHRAGRKLSSVVLYGRFSPSLRGTKIRVFATFTPLVWAFAVIWSVWVAAPLLEIGDIGSDRGTAALGFLLIGWSLTVYQFFVEVRRARALLREKLDLQVVSSLVA